MQQATSSSSAIVSSGGEHTKRSADTTVEGEIPMSEIKRPRGRPITRVLPMPSTVEYTEGCPGCREIVTIATHNANAELPTEQQLHLTEEVKTNVELPTVQPVHLTWEVQHLVWEVPFQCSQQVKLPGRAAISSQVGGVSNQIQVATHARVQAKAGPTAVHAGHANQETQLRAVHVGAAAVQVGAANETQLQIVDQNMADAQTDHDMADLAVVEHPHLHDLVCRAYT